MENIFHYEKNVKDFFKNLDGSLNLTELPVIYRIDYPFLESPEPYRDNKQSLFEDEEKFIFKPILNYGDGHCFYHTILRFINDYKSYFKEKGPKILINGEEKTVDNLIPDGYDPSHQKTFDVYLLKKSLLESYPDKYIFNTKLYTEDYKKYFYLKALEDSWKGKMTSNYAGDGPEGTVEFMDMANMLNICMVICNPDMYEDTTGNFYPTGGVTWNLYAPITAQVEGDMGVTNIADPNSCPLVLFINNTNGNHFDTLVPFTPENLEKQLAKQLVGMDTNDLENILKELEPHQSNAVIKEIKELKEKIIMDYNTFKELVIRPWPDKNDPNGWKKHVNEWKFVKEVVSKNDLPESFNTLEKIKKNLEIIEKNLPLYIKGYETAFNNLLIQEREWQIIGEGLSRLKKPQSPVGEDEVNLVGHNVELSGLSKADLNGKQVLVQGWEPTKGRYIVQLDEKSQISVPKKNIRLLPGNTSQPGGKKKSKKYNSKNRKSKKKRKL